MRALITGATGFIGRRLVSRIAEPVVLTRNPRRLAAEFSSLTRAFAWDPMREPPPSEAFEGVEAVFHLAGESVGEGRWTAAKKERIRESRAVGTARLAEALQALNSRPKVLVSASAVGYYGSRGDEVLDESAAPGSDFLAQVCLDWERAAAPARDAGVRVVHPRLGIVLGPGGGALAKMLPPFRFGLGGRLGDGQQWMPWIHLDDAVGLLLYAAEREDISGPMNAVAPQPLRNVEFTQILARVLHRPAIFPVPRLALRLAVGEFADILLSSQRAVPAVAQRAGYAFEWGDLETALAAILCPSRTHP